MKHRIQPLTTRPGEQGFSMIELTLALSIIALLLVPFIQQLNLELKQRKISQTNTNISTAESALKKYALRNGFYPLPANPSLGPGDPSDLFGVASTSITTTCTVNSTMACRANSFRDADAAGGLDYVYIGSLPFSTLSLPLEASIDGYGNKITYAVSQSLTNAGTFANNRGVIRLNNPDGSSYTLLSDEVHFMLISHGSAGRGAFTLNGAVPTPCIDSTSALAKRDDENCDKDATFDPGTVQAQGTWRKAKSNAGNNLDWDNYFSSVVTLEEGQWAPLPNGVTNANSGTVRVNASATADTRVRVEVGGDVRADRIYTANIGLTPNTNLNTACNGAGTSNWCIPPVYIGGTASVPANPAAPSAGDSAGLRCANGVAMSGISRGNQRCANGVANNGVTDRAITDPGSFVAKTCPTGQYAYGIDTNGAILCKAP